MSYYIPSVWRLLICICSVIEHATPPPPPPWLYAFKYHTSIINICRLITDSLKESIMWRNWYRHEKLHVHVWYIWMYSNVYVHIILYYLLQDLILKQKYITGNYWCNIIKHKFSTILFSTFVSDVYGLIWYKLYLIFSHPTAMLLCHWYSTALSEMNIFMASNIWNQYYYWA